MENIALITFILAFIITAVSGKPVITFLARLKFGQSIKDIGPKWHKTKQGTPTMGGIMFLIGIVFAFLTVGLFDGFIETRGIIVLVGSLMFAFIGFIDDYIKVVKKRNLGLRAREKLFLQIITACAFIASMQTMGYLTTKLYIPFINIEFELGIFYYLFAVFTIVAVVNAVNLTDGVDGLAAMVSSIVMIFYFFVGQLIGADSILYLTTAIAGALFGFLIFNFYPAKVFMGDTGSLFLGGAVALTAFALNIPLLILVAGVIYFIETLSVSLQVLYFKFTKGKRLFKMAPIHHHLEIVGWSEKKIVVIFSLITLLFSIFSLLTLIKYFNL